MIKFKKGDLFILKENGSKLIGKIYYKRKDKFYYTCLYNDIFDGSSYEEDKPGRKDNFEEESQMGTSIKRIKKKDVFLEVL